MGQRASTATAQTARAVAKKGPQADVAWRDGFAQMVLSRRSARGFVDHGDDAAEIAKLEADVAEALALAQRAPSGFNVQPYRAVVVRDALVRKQLAYTMLGGNIRRVLEAPVTVVWLADLQAWKLVDQVARLERERGGATHRESENLASDAKFLLGNMGGAATGPPAGQAGASLFRSILDRPLPGAACAESAAHTAEMSTKRALMTLLSQVTQAPTINSSAEAWAFKNTMLAAQTYLLAMSAFGYDSCPMEGFDARRVMEVVSAPQDRFSIPLVISSGRASKPSVPAPERPRFAFEDVFCRDSFDFPLFRAEDNNTGEGSAAKSDAK